MHLASSSNTIIVALRGSGAMIAAALFLGVVSSPGSAPADDASETIPTSLAFDSAGSKVAAGTFRGVVAVFDIESGRTDEFDLGVGESVLAVYLGEEAMHVATIGAKRSCALWTIENGRVLPPSRPRIEWANDAVFIGVEPKVKAIFTSQARATAVDPATGRVSFSVGMPRDEKYFEEFLALSPTANMAAVRLESPDLTSDRRESDLLGVWDGDARRHDHLLKRHQEHIWCAAFSPDGRTLASGGSDMTVRLWNVRTGEEIRKLEGHDRSVMYTEFSRDGKTIVSGGADSHVCLWEVATGRRIQSHDLDDGRFPARVDAGHTRFAAVTWRGDVEVHDFKTGKVLGRFAPTKRK